jgi:DNA-binding response OmpR family regulator
MVGIILDFNSNVVICGLGVVYLSPTEMDILKALHDAGERFFPSTKLDQCVWGKTTASIRNRRAVFLNRLRNKLSSIGFTISKRRGSVGGYRIERKST